MHVSYDLMVVDVKLILRPWYSLLVTGSGYTLSSIRTNPYNSDQSVADTIRQMGVVVRFSSQSLVVRHAISQATRDLDSTRSSDRDIARAIFYYVKSKVSFKEDEETNRSLLGMNDFEADDTELLITPEALLSMNQPAGDCDDFSTLTATMLKILGFRVAFVTIAADRNNPNVLSHVFVKTWLDDEKKGLYMDTSHGMYPGWEHASYTRKIEWPI